jgi:hypothetical protein
MEAGMRPFSNNPSMIRAFMIVSLSTTVMAALMSCRSDLGSGAVPVTSSSSSGGGESSISAGLYIAVATQWDGTSDWIDAGNCQIPLNSPSGTVNNTCLIHAPEARMYFSTTRFLVGSADDSMCKIITFQPYFYLGSNTDAAYSPPWLGSSSSTVDCTVAPTPAACYNGPATTIVTGFPSYTGTYFLSAVENEHTFTAASANSLLQTSNRWIANSKTNKAAGIAGVYVANSMTDYRVLCQDEWGETKYSITMKLADEDAESGEDPGGPLDTYSDWDGYP